MVDYSNFYIRTFIRVLKNNKCYNNSSKQYIKDVLLPMINSDYNVFPHKFMDNILFSHIKIYNDIHKSKIRRELIKLIIDYFINDLNKILINNNINLTLKKDENFIQGLLNGQFISYLSPQLTLKDIVKIISNINNCLYKRIYDN